MVGSTMACCLASAEKLKKKSILLLEAEKPKFRLKPQEPYIYSNRVSAINPASRSIFEDLGIWKRITQNAKLKTVKQLRVWDSCSSSSINFEHENFEHDIAYIVENANIIESCWRTLDELKCENLTRKTETTIKTLNLPLNLESLAQVELSDGTKCSSSLIIGADGANSFVRKAMDCHYVSWMYGQKGVVATLDIQTTGDNAVAWQRFTPNGPVALLPLTETKSSLVWTTTSQEADRLLQLPKDQFVDCLNRTLWEDVHQSTTSNSVLSVADKIFSYISQRSSVANQLPPTVIDVDEKSRAAFPLGFGHATRYIKTRAVLIGDAGHRLHPLAGQGVNLGFADCETLFRTLLRAVDEGADLGSPMYLKDYESKRQVKNLPVMLTMDFLNRLYRTELMPVVLARSLGLNFTNHVPLIKNFIIGQASKHF